MDADKYLQGSLRKYIEDLSSRKMTPGGGSAAAVSAALGAALNLMVINYSSKKGETLNAELLVLQTKQAEKLKRLSSLIDEDCRVFRELMDAISAGGGAQKEYIAAAGVPMDVCTECCLSIEVSMVLLCNSNRNLLTDIGCAANVLLGAFSSAELNVKINLARVEDSDIVEGMTGKLERLRKDIHGAVDEILKCIRDEMTGR